MYAIYLPGPERGALVRVCGGFARPAEARRWLDRTVGVWQAGDEYRYDPEADALYSRRGGRWFVVAAERPGPRSCAWWAREWAGRALVAVGWWLRPRP